VLSAVREATGLPFFEDADKVVETIARTYLLIVDQEARNWGMITQIVAEFLLIDHSRNALARISRLTTPESMLSFSEGFTRRMETSAKMMAEFSDGVLSPLLT